VIPESVKTQTRNLLKPLTDAVEQTKLPPNLLTYLGLILSALTGLVYWKGPFRFASLFLLCAGIADILDGEVARRSGQVTRFGAFLDSTLDRYSESFIWLGILLRYWSYEMVAAQIFAFFALVGSLLVSYTRTRSSEMGHETRLGPLERPERMVLIFIGTLFGMDVFVWFVLALAVLTNLTVIVRIAYLSRQKELR